MKKTFAAAVVVLVLMMVACSTGLKIANLDSAIIKDQKIYLGQSQEAVERLLGAPDKIINDQNLNRVSMGQMVIGSRVPATYSNICWVYGEYHVIIENRVVGGIQRIYPDPKK